MGLLGYSLDTSRAPDQSPGMFASDDESKLVVGVGMRVCGCLSLCVSQTGDSFGVQPKLVLSDSWDRLQQAWFLQIITSNYCRCIQCSNDTMDIISIIIQNHIYASFYFYFTVLHYI